MEASDRFCPRRSISWATAGQRGAAHIATSGFRAGGTARSPTAGSSTRATCAPMKRRSGASICPLPKRQSPLGRCADPFGGTGLRPLIGSDGHRAVAREAVSKSQVLLKNRDAALPIPPNVRRLLVAGAAADDIGLQCGGWTIEWQGGRGAITDGTTLLQGIEASVSPDASLVFQANGEFAGERGEVGIVVLSEPPYSEGEGDRYDLSLPP